MSHTDYFFLDSGQATYAKDPATHAGLQLQRPALPLDEKVFHLLIRAAQTAHSFTIAKKWNAKRKRHLLSPLGFMLRHTRPKETAQWLIF